MVRATMADSRRSSPDPGADGPDPGDRFDVEAVVRAASAGFTYLIVAELAAVVLGLVGLPGGLLIAVFAAAVYAIVGRRAASGNAAPMLHGGLAALSAYVLTIPLRFIASDPEPAFIATGLVFAVVVGGLAGRIESRSAAT